MPLTVPGRRDRIGQDRDVLDRPERTPARIAVSVSPGFTGVVALRPIVNGELFGSLRPLAGTAGAPPDGAASAVGAAGEGGRGDGADAGELQWRDAGAGMDGHGVSD